MQAMKAADHLALFKSAYARFFAAGNDPLLVKSTVEEAARTPVQVILAELEGLVVDTVVWAREVSQPVLWISAAPRAGETDAAGVARVFAQPAYGQVVGAAHFPQLEVPDQVNAMLERFLRKFRGADAPPGA
jgi:pimeloyl-ACP methyl ester carboxylesterase